MDNFEIFESLTDFSRALNTRKVNEYYRCNGESSHKDTPGCKKFTTTKDYQTADSLLLNGDKDNAAKVQKALAQSIKVDGKVIAPQRTVYCSQQGFLPNMGRVMAGHPQNMFNVRRELRDSSKVITIIYDTAAPGSVPAGDIVNAGAKLLSAVNALEKNGYRCNIYAGMFIDADVTKGSEEIGVYLKLNKPGKMLDVTRAAYTLVNPSFLRRHCFAWTERREDTQDPVYGYPLSEQRSKQAIKTNCPKLEGAYFANLDVLRTSGNTIDKLKRNRI